MLIHSPIRRRHIGGSVVLPDQFVGAVVLVCDRGAAPGYGGYVPVVVEGVDRVAAILVHGEKNLEPVDGSSKVNKRTIPLALIILPFSFHIYRHRL